jgi:hypothetical protein
LEASGIFKEVKKGSIIFYLYFQVQALQKMMETCFVDGEFVKTVPVQNISKISWKKQIFDFKVKDVSMFIPLSKNMAKLLETFKLISPKTKESDEQPEFTWYYLEESEEGM